MLGHVRHRASGRQIGQDHRDLFGAEHVSGLGHEVHAAENQILDRLLPADPGSELAELEAVARQVGVLDDRVGLVVVPEDDQAIAQALAPVCDVPRKRFRVGCRVALRQ